MSRGGPPVLGPFELAAPSRANIGPWLDAIGSWARATGGALEALRDHALEDLLAAEEEVAAALAADRQLPDAPPPMRAPRSYPTMVIGAERPRQTLGWWDRFQIADGIEPTLPAAGGRRQHRRQRDLGVAVARRGATARRQSVPTRHDRHGFLRGAAGKAASRLARPLGTAHAWQMGMRMRTRTGFVALMALWIAAGCALELYGDDDDGSGLPCGGIAGGTCEGDEFCDYRVEHACGTTDGGGVCRARPTACPEIYAPVIGSDGVRYDNACFAHAAGADDCGPAATP